MASACGWSGVALVSIVSKPRNSLRLLQLDDDSESKNSPNIPQSISGDVEGSHLDQDTCELSILLPHSGLPFMQKRCWACLISERNQSCLS